MSAATAQAPRIIHSVPGRVRIHLPWWLGRGQNRLEHHCRKLNGVHSVQANRLTRNILFRFDRLLLDERVILEHLRTYTYDTEIDTEGETTPPHVVSERRGERRRARIAVRGLDRDPALASRVVARLHEKPGVRARANPLTGRVLVEFSEQLVDLEDIVCEVTSLELPEIPGEDRPAHPLDPAPLVQSAARTAAATVGLGWLGLRTLPAFAGTQGAASTAAWAAGIIGLLQGFPIFRNTFRMLLGRNLASFLFNAAGIVALTLAGSPLGLVASGLEALRLLTEVVARRAAWRRYEERLEGSAALEPGAVIRLEAGERAPLTCCVIEGTGTVAGHHGLPVPVEPGATIHAGARVSGGPFVVELLGQEAFEPEPRPTPPKDTLYDRYIQFVGPLALVYTAIIGFMTRQPARIMEALLLVNPRTAVIGKETASMGAAARVLRSGVIVVGTRPHRHVRLPDYLLLGSPRLLTEGVELTSAQPLSETRDPQEIISLASGISAAAGSPWGNAFPVAGHSPAVDGAFDGNTATATIGETRFSLAPHRYEDGIPEATQLRHKGDYLLVLRSEREEKPLGIVVLRPRLAHGVADLVETCRRYRVRIGVLHGEDSSSAQAISRRAGVPLIQEEDAVEAVRRRQRNGGRVAYLSDSAQAARAFEACDLAIGLSSGRSGHFAARADLLAPDLTAMTSILDAGARRDATARDSVFLSIISNVLGVIWGFRGRPGVEQASRLVYAASLAAMGTGWLRLRGGERPQSAIAQLVDPRPERWGNRTIESTLQALGSSEDGLTTSEAVRRLSQAKPRGNKNELLRALVGQITSPLVGILAAGALFSFLIHATLDVAIIAATIVINVAVGLWQERKAGQAAEALAQMGRVSARVLRDGEVVMIPATDVVPGDILLLAPGDRVAADARLIESNSLEVDEAALTGESFPVPKMATDGPDVSRVVLEGSDVTTGTGRAVVVAVGRQTRMGATAAALAIDETQQSPLGRRLGRMLQQALPMAVAAGAIVVTSGVWRGQSILSQLALGASIALAAVPEGLPLLAGMGEAAVARRLATRNALVRKLSAVEALGRVDVACTDKTGTLTEGRLAVSLVADAGQEAALPGEVDEHLRRVLLAAALASPHPDAADAAAHPTDVAIIRGAESAGLSKEVRARRQKEVPFDPARSFHAATSGGRLFVKGAPEALAAWCTHEWKAGDEEPLDDSGRQALLDRAHKLAERGLRVLMVAEGSGKTQPDNPSDLTAMGFVGISDPLRATVPAAIRRCHEAGVRVIMLTGDHPATARAIAREAGLLNGGGEIITGDEIAELQNGDLERRLEQATVIARATPLDKLRIVESLQRRGHTVAMTGDGVNDAPALRLADVGVAMGRAGTEVARQAADVVLADDDFATLVETFVEGRGFWQNMRRALGLLLGGNLGELGIMVGATAFGLMAPLNTRQILSVNLITDALPALSVALQRPEHRNLAGLAREGTSALDAPLRRDILRRGAATALPTLASYFAMVALGDLPQAASVSFISMVSTQLAQTLDAGWSEGTLTRPVFGAVATSAGLLAATLAVPSLRALLGLALPSPVGWALIGAGTITAVIIGRLSVPSRLPQPVLDGAKRIDRLAMDVRQRTQRLLPAPAPEPEPSPA